MASPVVRPGASPDPGGTSRAEDPGGEGLRRPRRAQRRGRAGPALHRPAPGARGDQPAGVRRPPRRRPHGAPPRAHDGDRGPQRPDAGHPPAHRRPGQPRAGRGAAPERRRVRHPPGPDGRPRPGHRARHRPAAGADRAGLIAPDRTTFDFLQGRPHAPQGADWDAAVEYWETLRTDEGAVFDTEVVIDAAELTPYVTWGTNPGQGLPIAESVPDPAAIADEGQRRAAEQALAYMGLAPGTPLREIEVDTVFLGSCTNGRIEDLRIAAELLRGQRIDPHTRMLVVPGSVAVKAQAEAEGLDKVFVEAGAEWRGAGGSVCLGLKPRQLKPGERSASTSNRNFQGRQGKGGRTHLVSPAVAAATALTGRLTAPADLTDVPATAGV